MDLSWIPKPEIEERWWSMFFYFGVLFVIVAFIPGSEAVFIERRESFFIGIGLLVIFTGELANHKRVPDYKEYKELVEEPLTPYDAPRFRTVRIREGEKIVRRFSIPGTFLVILGSLMVWFFAVRAYRSFSF